jgi:hypothetical protein
MAASSPSGCRAWNIRYGRWLTLAILVANDHYLKGRDHPARLAYGKLGELIAVAMFPLAWSIWGRLAAAVTRSQSHWHLCFAVALCGAGCVATSSGRSGQASLYLLNATRRTQVFAIHRAVGDACNNVDGDPADVLPAEVFTFERCVELSPLDLVELDPPGIGTTVDPRRRCDAVVVKAPGSPGVGLWWGDTTVRPIDTAFADLDDRRVKVLQVGAQLFYESPPIALKWEIPDDLVLTQCPSE